MTEGVVTGGWGFVSAAYALTFLAFAVYGATLLAKLRSEKTRSSQQEKDLS